jgi:hypothetical protein
VTGIALLYFTMVKMRMIWAVGVICMRAEIKISMEDLSIHKRILLKWALKK